MQLPCQPSVAWLDVCRCGCYSAVNVACATGDGAACAVLLNGRTVNSCVVLVKHCEGKKIVTIEGVANKDGTLHPLQKAFLDEGGAQCGFCTPGLILSAKELLDENPTPTEADVKEAL